MADVLPGSLFYTNRSKSPISGSTSVIGGCFDHEFSLWSNSLLEDIRNHHFVFATSEIVALEISRAPEEVKLKYGELLESCEPIVCTPNPAEPEYRKTN